MYAFRSSVDGLSEVESRLAEVLADRMRGQYKVRVSPAEARSWEQSLPVLRRDLMDAGLGQVEMLIEYALPYSSKRADVVLAGEHPRTGRHSYVLVELKQWSAADLYEDDPSLVCIPSYGSATAVAHPLLQVAGYRQHLVDFTSTLAQDPDCIEAVAYLHNAVDVDVAPLQELAPPDRTRMITGQGRGALMEYLASRLAPTSGAAAADALIQSPVGPTKPLLSVAADEVERREMFVLLDEQRAAYEHVLHAVAKSRRSDHKTAVIVTGGPGSGKSVIALSLLGELSREGRSVMHATGSKSFTTTLRKVAAARAPRVRDMLVYFNQFINAEQNGLDCLILDEAHRIRSTSANRYTAAALRTGRPQVEELIDAARVPVFLLDQNQVVRPGEIGTVESIHEAARDKGLDIVQIDLDGQFRCGGSEAFLDWVQRLLGLRDGGPSGWKPDGRFSVAVADTPADLERRIAAHRDAGTTARMAAGFCWPWSDSRNGALVADVVIGDWRRPWNVKGERSVGGAPAASLWATDPAGFGQVGCVYTAQGFEYDYAGVIIGPDMVWRGGGWVTDRKASRDPAFGRGSGATDADIDLLIRHVYKVLLTRGLAGVVIYSVDQETREFLSTLVSE